MTKVNLFDPQLGIQNIIENQDSYKLPNAQPLATNTVYVSNESTYNAVNIKTLLEHAVCPDTGDGELLRADVFSNALETCADELKHTQDSDIQNFLQNDLYPLLENKELLRTYYNLMIGG